MRRQTQAERNQEVIRLYRESGEPWPATAKQMAAWAIRKDKWAPRRDSLINQCAEQLAEAMREEYYVDPQGRTVRTKHTARVKLHGEQLNLWADIRTADHKFMRMAFQQRRKQIVGDCRQLKNDVDSYNENANAGSPIQLVLDFSQDVAELETMEVLARQRNSRSPRSPYGERWAPPPTQPIS